MKTGTRWERAIAIAFVVLAAMQGCAVKRSTTKEVVPPGLSVRLPPAELTTIDVRSQPSIGRPELPLSVADESRGRWLTLFELNYSPVKPSVPVAEEEPSR